jgi:tetratricopeptide (TPR) repeat protein
MHRAAHLLGQHSPGLVVALVPEEVADPAAWCESVILLDAARGSPRVRVAAFASERSPLRDALGDGGAFFEVIRGELDEPAARLDGNARAEEPQGNDASSATKGDAGTKLGALLLDASTAHRVGGLLEAAKVYREARALGEFDALHGGLMALGRGYLSAQVLELAIESYREAALLAEDQGAWAPACEAWLWLGGIYLRREKYIAASVGFRMALAAARHAESVPLRVEALRLWGICLLRLGRQQEAILTWQDAVNIGAAGDAAERDMSTFCEVADALVNLLELRGLDEQARRVRAIAAREIGTSAKADESLDEDE